jgi:hypothetical protein
VSTAVDNAPPAAEPADGYSVVLPDGLEWLTAEQAAAWLGISRRRLDDLKASGRLDRAFFQAGSTLRYHREALKEVLLRGPAPVPVPKPTTMEGGAAPGPEGRKRLAGLEALRAGILPPRKGG